MGSRSAIPLLSRIAPLVLDALPAEMQARVRAAEDLMGFVANDVLIMARDPRLLEAFAKLVGAVYAPGQIEPGFKRLLGLMASAAAGCVYCTGHTAFASARHGVSESRLNAVWTFEESGEFSAAEKAALRIALHGSQSPSTVDDAMYADLASHYDEAAQLEIVAVVSLFGFLNRWNATFATQLESQPAEALTRLEVHRD